MERVILSGDRLKEPWGKTGGERVPGQRERSRISEGRHSKGAKSKKGVRAGKQESKTGGEK